MPTSNDQPQQNQLEPTLEPSTETSETLLESLSTDSAFAPAASEASTPEEEEQLIAVPQVYHEYTPNQLQAAVEALLFLHHKPVAISKLRELINPAIPEDDYRTAISNIMATYFEEARGIELVEIANGYQFRTKMEHKDVLRRMFQIAPLKLTNAMLEVLAIAAYNQPITKDMVEQVRGVDSSHLIRVLMDKKMLRIAGKSDDLGKPMLYATTKEFLELFGLRDLSALPSLREIEDMLPKNEVGAISEEELLAKEMEVIVAASKPVEFNDLELLEEGLENGSESIEKRETRTPHPGTIPEALSAQANSHGSAPSHGSETRNTEADSEAFDLEAKTLGSLPFGPTGNA